MHFEGKGPLRRPQKPLDSRLEEVAKAVGGCYCRLQMPFKLALAVRETVAEHRMGALDGGGGGVSPSNASLGGGGGMRSLVSGWNNGPTACTPVAVIPAVLLYTQPLP